METAPVNTAPPVWNQEAFKNLTVRTGPEHPDGMTPANATQAELVRRDIPVGETPPETYNRLERQRTLAVPVGEVAGRGTLDFHTAADIARIFEQTSKPPSTQRI